MFLVFSNYFNPYFNLAAEEFYLKFSNDDMMMLWRSGPAVIVGKHQNTLAEINLPFVHENNIAIARRLSGGGAVVHDMQNVNFTFITNGDSGKLINFEKFTLPVINYLKVLGVDANFYGKNDIRIGDLKISGNAEHIYKNRILHHGTLLFNSDLNRLNNALKTEPGKYFDKAVKSQRATVSNISNYLNVKTGIDEFISGLSDYILNAFQNTAIRNIQPEEIVEIEKLVKEKYTTEEWIFGYSPKYEFRKNFLFQKQKWQVELQVEKGIIVTASVYISGKHDATIEGELTGKCHYYCSISSIVKKCFPQFNNLAVNGLTFFFF